MILQRFKSILAIGALAFFSMSAQGSIVTINQGTPLLPGEIKCQNTPSDPGANCYTAATFRKGTINSRNYLVPNVSTPEILDAFKYGDGFNAGVPGFADLTELYKAESFPYEDDPSNPGGQSGPLKDAYTTVFEFVSGGEDYRGATITYNPAGGPAVDCSIECYLLVKDGDHSPAAYLFDLALGSVWDGEMDLVLKNFWLGNGSISHIALYGNISAIPLPAGFWLFGTALLGFIGLSRSTRV